MGQGGLGGPPVWPGGFRNLSQRVERHREAHTDVWGVGIPPKGLGGVGVPHGVQEGSQGPPGGPEGVKRPSRREGRGLGALLESREGLRGPEEYGILSQRARRGREAHP